MDAHFHEYMAAVAGMQELYGEPAHGLSEFHDGAHVVGDAQPETTVDCPLTAPAAETTAVTPAIVAEVRETVASADTAVFAKAV
jgi:hypothetical protein